ncbi:hypothetical protein QJQ45_009299 [Haematococcus lacustris]|nr:hypothetical protein QJQ45_009299 [Haematococcus lacustris]
MTIAYKARSTDSGRSFVTPVAGPFSSNSSPAEAPGAAAAAAHAPHLQHLVAASSASTSLEANLKHITVTLATRDAMWELYLDPEWVRQRLRLYGAQDRALAQFFKKVRVSRTRCERCSCTPSVRQQLRLYGAQDRALELFFKKLEKEMAELSMECQSVAKQMVVLFVASRKPPQAPCSSQEARQPAVSELGPSTPSPAKRSKRTKAEQASEPTQPTKGKGKAQGEAANAKPAP